MKVRQNIEIDAKNWWRISNYNFFGLSFRKQINKKFLKKIKHKKYENVKNLIKEEIRKNFKKNEKEFNWLNKKFLPYWDKKEKEIINVLDKIHKKKFPVKFVKIYYTSIEMNFYGKEKEGFYITMNGKSKDADLLCSAIIHELMHLYFRKYYFKKCLKKGLNSKQIEDIKEALTVLINEEFKKIIKTKDKGYKIHEKLREFILKEWKKKKDFNILLNKCIKKLNKK